MGESFLRKIKASALFSLFWLLPYFAHGASCAKLNIEWTPLPTIKRRMEDIVRRNYDLEGNHHDQTWMN